MSSHSGVAACAIAFGLLGCGGSDSSTASTPVPDGGASDSSALDGGSAPDAAGSPDAGDAAAGPVTLVDTTPADAALHIGVLAPVKLHFSGSLMASSVNATNVLLLAPNATAGVPASVTYDDATHTITLAPKTALATGGVYRVTSASILAADGAAIADVAVSFTTLFNNATGYTLYSATGVLGGYTTYVLDAQGRTTRRAQMTKGPDMIYQTADDVPSAYSAIVYGQGTYRTLNYSGPGTDMTWFTADDALATYADVDTTVVGRPRGIYHVGPGADMMWQTSDDAIGTFYENATTADGREATSMSYSGPGADGVPFTADDVITYRFADTWTATTGQRVEYTAPGADAMWNTADDVVATVNGYILDSLGRTTAFTSIGKGPDGVFLTADDVVTSAIVYSYDANGLATKLVMLNGAGADGVWLTMDDSIGGYYTLVHDASGALVTYSLYAAGADALWNTADDVATYVEQHDTSL